MGTCRNSTFQFRKEEVPPPFFFILSAWPKVNFAVEILKTNSVILPVSRSLALSVKNEILKEKVTSKIEKKHG